MRSSPEDLRRRLERTDRQLLSLLRVTRALAIGVETRIDFARAVAAAAW